MPDAQSLTPAHAKGGIGSIGLPMDVTPQRAQATGKLDEAALPKGSKRPWISKSKDGLLVLKP